MKRFFYYLRRPVVWLFFLAGYLIGHLFYDGKYLTGRHFLAWHYSPGWQWVLRYWFPQKVLGYNRQVPWPVPPWAAVTYPRNFIFDPDDMNNFQGAGSYFQAIDGTVTIGKGTYIASGVGIITANHDPADPERHLPGKDVVLGEGCWIGKNAVILPGVTLGPHTTVGAGAVVSKSVPEGFCILAGAPAKKIRELPRTEAALKQEACND